MSSPRWRASQYTWALARPPFSEAAGVQSSMSLPLVTRHEGVKALNCYSRVSAAFSDDDVEVGLQFATHAAIVLG